MNRWTTPHRAHRRGTGARFTTMRARSAAIDACARVPAITLRWEENLTELRRYVGTVFVS